MDSNEMVQCWQYSTDSIQKDSLVRKEVFSISGFDVRETSIGLTTTGRRAEISRATAL